MSPQLFITLPVADLAKSKAFYMSLGYSYDPQFSDDTAARIIVSDSISLMLGTYAKFREFTPKAVCDTSQAVEVLLKIRFDTALLSGQRTLAAGWCGSSSNIRPPISSRRF